MAWTSNLLRRSSKLDVSEDDVHYNTGFSGDVTHHAFIKQQAEQRMAERLAALGIKTPAKGGETAAQRAERARKEREDRLKQAEAEDARRRSHPLKRREMKETWLLVRLLRKAHGGQNEYHVGDTRKWGVVKRRRKNKRKCSQGNTHPASRWSRLI